MQSQKRWLPWILLGALIAVGAAILFVAPNEKTMGAGIKPVYVHVAFSWVGVVGILLAGGMGLLLLVRDSKKLFWWMEVVSWIGLVWFLAGIVLSFLAAKANWGGIFLAEPRTAAGLKFIAIALIAKTVVEWLPWRKLGALVNIALVGVLWLTTFSAPLILHPKDPIRTATSVGIQTTFGAMFVVVLLFGVWVAWMIRRRQSHDLV